LEYSASQIIGIFVR